MNNKSIIQIFEHQVLKVGDNPRFGVNHFKALEKYGYKTGEKYFSIGNQRIKFNKYVGVIQVKNLTLEVLPKADNSLDSEESKAKWHDVLVSMLHECKLIKINAISRAKLKLASTSILDLYYDLFLTETETVFKHGLRKAYRPTRNNLNKVKGKIVFTEHIKKNSFHQERFYVEHKIFDANNKLNQILLKALLILKSLSHKSSFNTRINKLLLSFGGISEANVTSSWFERLKYDRNTERYRQAITLAKLIILRYSPDLKGGNENVLSIMFDMNLLYENYIFRKLKKLQANPSSSILKVSEQNRTPFWESRGLRADILIETSKKNIVIDTKWKVLKDDKPSDNDLKQMFVYNLHYDADLSILLYPQTIYKTNSKKPFRDKKFRDKNCQVAYVNLFTDSGKLDPDLAEKIYNDLIEPELSINGE